MVNDQFVRCCDCDAIHRVTPSNGGSSRRVDDDVTAETDGDNWRAFTERHTGHEQESLELTGATYRRGRHHLNGSDSIYLEATNGQARYLLCQSRNAADEPFVYHVVAVTGGVAAP